MLPGWAFIRESVSVSDGGWSGGDVGPPASHYIKETSTLPSRGHRLAVNVLRRVQTELPKKNAPTRAALLKALRVRFGGT